MSMVPVLMFSGCSNADIFEFNIMNELLAEFEESENPQSGGNGNSIAEISLPENMNEAYVNFSLELFKRNLTEGENSLISPTSAQFALTMAAMGADGDTKTEMLNVLCPGFTEEELVTYANSLDTLLTQSQPTAFHIANSMWVNETLIGDCLNETYANALKEDMDAEAHMMPFNQKAVDEINDWVNENTHEMIPELLEQIPADVAMYLINAMTFEGKWSDQYSDYQVQDKTFTNADGVEEKADMLCETGNFYLENDDATGFIKYYEGGQYAFLAMLPKEDGTLDNFVANLTGEDYIAFYESLTTEYDVKTELPCFTYSYSTTMNDSLKEMGMPTAFTEGAADFSPMLTDETRHLYISNVIHKTYIELDQNGTKAAAVTAVEMTLESAALEEPKEIKEVILDRPFVYAIVDTQNGLPIFIGTVNSVAK